MMLEAGAETAEASLVAIVSDNGKSCSRTCASYFPGLKLLDGPARLRWMPLSQ